MNHRRRVVIAFAALLVVVELQEKSWSQQLTPSPQLFGGTGSLVVSRFVNPALLGALYSTPYLPLTGYYPLYPGRFTTIRREQGMSAGPVILHPSMGIAEMYTDNVFRTDANRRSDFFTTLAPGIQAQLPFSSGRHLFMADYQTNIQYYSRTPSNNVQDQTASGRLQFNFPWGGRLDLQGQHKLGHDPRGSAFDLQNLEVNKWTANGFTAQMGYDGTRLGAVFTTQILRWDFLNNDQGIYRNQLSNYVGLTLTGTVSRRTSILVDFHLIQTIYDQNKNLDGTVYTGSVGARWDITGKTTGEFLVGYQVLKFDKAPVQQEGPILSQFNREPGKDTAPGFFVSGSLSWKPTSGLTLVLQPYRTIQQTVLLGTFFFTSTGVNLSAVQKLTGRMDATLNAGLERDKFDSSLSTGPTGSSRSDTLKNIAVGVNYRAVKWLGISFQYVFEDRTSNVQQFNYFANTVMVSLQTLF
ncbi:surface lipoprotein assembly modifier [Nitrospira sp. Nam74]